MDDTLRVSLPAELEMGRQNTTESFSPRSDNRRGKSRVWKSCCLTLDREFTMFLTKYFILIGLMVFFAVELHFATDCSEQQLFMSMLTLIVGLAIPSPQVNNK